MIDGSPEDVGIDSERLNRAFEYLAEKTKDGSLPAASLAVSRHGIPIAMRGYGRRAPGSAEPASADSIYLVASVTKMFTVTSVMMLLDRGKVLLDDPVAHYIPEFGNRGKEEIKVFHLMTHTSGLPDMLPNNLELRKAHAPLSEFYRHMHDLELDFPPGTNIQYQSCGTNMLAEIVERVSGLSIREFMRQEIFEPLGMADTSLGVNPTLEKRIAAVNVPVEHVGADWGWTSNYWRNFGAPWGGMFSTVGDTTRFMQMFLNGGELDGAQLLSLAAVELMVRDHTSEMPLIAESVKYGQTWGLGWRLHPANWGYSGDLLSPSAFAHGGATGTDPVLDLVCVLYTTEPSAASKGILSRCSNLVAASAL